MRYRHSLLAEMFLVGTACGTADGSSGTESASNETEVAPAAVPPSSRLMDAAAMPMMDQPSSAPWNPFLDAGRWAFDSEACSIFRVQLDAGTAAGDCVIPCRDEWRYGTCKRPNDIFVNVDGRMREQENTADGWRWGSDLCTVVLVGAACEDLRAGGLLEIYARCVLTILC